jgi:hypothetical protein
MLFPWARCFLWCRDHGVPMVAPIWTQLRIGPYLRHERDKRNYQRLFRHHGYVDRVSRLLLLALAQRVSEDLSSESLREPQSGITLVVFKGVGELFSPLCLRHDTLLAELKSITRPVFVDASLANTAFIGIHVRRGDFSVPRDDRELREGRTNCRIPLRWYVSALNAIRSALLCPATALVFTDGSETEIQELLNMPNVRLFRGESAITDLLALSGARAMVASGSTFSMWASFLGQVPCLWHPGQRLQCVISSDEDGLLEPEWENNGSLSASFLEVLRERWLKP